MQLWSFVDNLETTSHHPEGIDEGFRSIRAFCHELGIQLDESKTVTWATSTQHREWLRNAGHPVIHDTKDLGGQMTFCRCHTNKVLRARTDTLTDYWPRLARSPAPLRQKQISLRVAAWPRALYGISTTIFWPRSHQQTSYPGTTRTWLDKQRDASNVGIVLHV